MRTSCSSRLARSQTRRPAAHPFSAATSAAPRLHPRLHISAAPRLHLGCTSAKHLGYTSPQPARIQTTSGSLPSGSYLRCTPQVVWMSHTRLIEGSVRQPTWRTPPRPKSPPGHSRWRLSRRLGAGSQTRPFGRDTPPRPAKAASMRCVLAIPRIVGLIGSAEGSRVAVAPEKLQRVRLASRKDAPRNRAPGRLSESSWRARGKVIVSRRGAGEVRLCQK